MKSNFLMRFQCLFFLFLTVLSCQKAPDMNYEPVVHSSWQSSFLLKYRTFAFGKLQSQNSQDPFFSDISLRSRFEKEFRYNFEPLNLSVNTTNPDLLIFTYFTGPNLPLPITTYLLASPDLDQFQVSDSLKKDELFLVMDFVQPQNLYLVLRMVVKMQFKEHQISIKELQAVLQATAQAYPG
jgi:hypothetical protein